MKADDQTYAKGQMISARKTIAAEQRARRNQALAADPAHEHEWKGWNSGDVQGRVCSSCRTNQVLHNGDFI